MNDKERLEDFREFIDFMYESIDIEDHQRFVAISESMIKDGWFKWIYRYAKEQAERVQSLEFENHSVMQELNHVDAENKRYLEAIESVKNKLNDVSYQEYETANFRHEIFSELLEALEESE